MNYYTVSMIGDGSEANPFRPDIPIGTSFAGSDSTDGTFLIATITDLGTDTINRTKQLPRQALEATANARGLLYNDVAKWFVGG